MDDFVTLTALSGDGGKRIDVFLSEKLEISRSGAAKLIENGNVELNGKAVAKNLKIKENMIFEVTLPDPVPSEAVPQNIPLDILYEDDDLLVVNKQKGMVVHPAAGNPDGTLVNALLHHCGDSLSGIGGVIRPGIVHRIDKDTSGLLVIAKNDETHLALSEQMKTHTVSRVYHAVVCGNVKEDSGTINAPIGRSPSDRKKMAVLRDPSAHSREAITHFEVISRFDGFTYLKCILETGRTHQIRVHMASTGHPLAGDTVYGGGRTKFEEQNAKILCGQCLHAKELSFIHPKSGQLVHFESPLPHYFEIFLDKLAKK